MVTPVQQMLVAVAKVAPLWDGSMGTLWDGGGGSGGAADAGGSGEVCPTTAGYWAEPAIGQSGWWWWQRVLMESHCEKIIVLCPSRISTCMLDLCFYVWV